MEHTHLPPSDGMTNKTDIGPNNMKKPIHTKKNIINSNVDDISVLEKMKTYIQVIEMAKTDFLENNFYKDLDLYTLPEKIPILKTFTIFVQEYIEQCLTKMERSVFSLPEEVKHFHIHFCVNIASSQLPQWTFLTSQVVNSQEKMWVDELKKVFGKLQRLITWYSCIQELAHFLDTSLQNQKVLEEIQEMPIVSAENTSAVNALFSLFLDDFPYPPHDFGEMLVDADFEKERQILNQVIFQPTTSVSKAEDSVFLVGSRKIFFSSFVTEKGQLMQGILPEKEKQINFFVISEGPIVLDRDLTCKEGSIQNLFICCSQLICEKTRKIALTGQRVKNQQEGESAEGEGGNICLSTLIPMSCPSLSLVSIGGDVDDNFSVLEHLTTMTKDFDALCKWACHKLSLVLPNHSPSQHKNKNNISSDISDELNQSIWISKEMFIWRLKNVLAIKAAISLFEMLLSEDFNSNSCCFCDIVQLYHSGVNSQYKGTTTLDLKPLRDQVIDKDCDKSGGGECPVVTVLKSKRVSKQYVKLQDFDECYQQFRNVECLDWTENMLLEIMKSLYEQMKEICLVFIAKIRVEYVNKRVKLEAMSFYSKIHDNQSKFKGEYKNEDDEIAPGCPGSIEMYPDVLMNLCVVRKHGLNGSGQRICKGIPSVSSDECKQEAKFHLHLAHQLKTLSSNFPRQIYKRILSILLRHDWAVKNVFTVEYFAEEYLLLTKKLYESTGLAAVNAANQIQEEVDFQNNIQTFQNARELNEGEIIILHTILKSCNQKKNALEKTDFKSEHFQTVEIWVDAFLSFLDDSSAKKNLFSQAQLEARNSFHFLLYKIFQGINEYALISDEKQKKLFLFNNYCKISSLGSLANGIPTISDLSKSIEYCHVHIKKFLLRFSTRAKIFEHCSTIATWHGNADIVQEISKLITGKMFQYFVEMKMLLSEEHEMHWRSPDCNMETLNSVIEETLSKELKALEDPYDTMSHIRFKDGFRKTLEKLKHLNLKVFQYCKEVESIKQEPLDMFSIGNYMAKLQKLFPSSPYSCRYPVPKSTFQKIIGCHYIDFIINTAQESLSFLNKETDTYVNLKGTRNLQDTETFDFTRRSKTILEHLFALTTVLNKSVNFWFEKTPFETTFGYSCDTLLDELDMRINACKIIQEYQYQLPERVHQLYKLKLTAESFLNLERDREMGKKLDRIQLLSEFEMMLIEYEKVRRKCLHGVFPFAEEYSAMIRSLFLGRVFPFEEQYGGLVCSCHDFLQPICTCVSKKLTVEIVTKVAEKCKILLSFFEEVEEKQKFAEKWSTAEFVGEEPFYQWNNWDQIKKLLSGGTTKFVANIKDHPVDKDALMVTKSLGLRFVCAPGTSRIHQKQYELDSLLKNFDARIDRDSTSICKLAGNYYRTYGEHMTMKGYVQPVQPDPTAVNADKSRHTLNSITNCCGSPYTEWAFTLIPTHGPGDQKLAQAELVKWCSKERNVTLQLVGVGKYIKRESTEWSQLNLDKVRNYYDLVDV